MDALVPLRGCKGELADRPVVVEVSEGVSEKGLEGRTRGEGDEGGKSAAQEHRALCPEKACCHEVQRDDEPFGGKNDIAHRREIVELSEASRLLLGEEAGSRELLILHLEFDLVDFELLHEPLQVGLAVVAGRSCPGPRLRLTETCLCATT